MFVWRGGTRSYGGGIHVRMDGRSYGGYTFVWRVHVRRDGCAKHPTTSRVRPFNAPRISQSGNRLADALRMHPEHFAVLCVASSGLLAVLLPRPCVRPNSQLHRRQSPEVRQDFHGQLQVVHACMKSSMILRTTSDGVRLLMRAKRVIDTFVSGVIRMAKIVFLSFCFMATR